MLSQLKPIIPGSTHWPRFLRNGSEQFEARLVLVEVVDSPSVLLSGMQGSRLPIVVSNGEGRAEFESQASLERALTSLRFVQADGSAASEYPGNPNGSQLGVTGLTSEDGRATILMPHPERTLRSVNLSWHPREWPDASPWMRLFHNARTWVG